MPWLAEVEAVLFAGLPGQEAGDAVAAALTGDIEPSGRLVTTFPARDGQGPAWSPTPSHGKLPYTEGIGVGYRGWSQSGEEPLFWFGHGLGYSQWDYQHAEVTGFDQESVTNVRITVANSGNQTSRETLQVYLFPEDPKVPARLIGWAQISLAPGDQARVDVPCDARAQRTWNTSSHRWQPFTGGSIVVARGLGDVRLNVALKQSVAATAGALEE
jgi:beta-glucosidase